MPFRTFVTNSDHPDLKVTRRQAVVRARSTMHFCGYSPPRTLGSFLGNVDNMKSALLERMLTCKVGGVLVQPLSTSKEAVAEKLGAFGNAVVSLCPSFTPVSLDDFVEMYKGPKRNRYADAVASLRREPIRRRDGEVSAFVKREKAKFDKSPRAIQTRDPRYHAMVGRVLKPLEKKIYKAIAKVFDTEVVVTKGLNLDGVATVLHRKWNKFTAPVAVGLDATKFDAHVSAPLLQWEHSVYTRVCKLPWFKRLLGWQVNNKGKSFCPDGKVKYTCLGRRMSGDMNTGLGNCLIMCAMVYSYAKERGVHIELANNGDDCVVIMEQAGLEQFLNGLDEWFANLGFRLVAEPPVTIFEQIEFCQMHPIAVGDGYRMVRDPRVCLEKDTMCTMTLSDAGYFEWLKGVSQCGLVATDGIPLLSSFYGALARESAHASKAITEVTGMSFLVKGMTHRDRGVSQRTRFSFWLAYGVTPDQQVDLENELDSTLVGTNVLDQFHGTPRVIDKRQKSVNIYTHSGKSTNLSNVEL